MNEKQLELKSFTDCKSINSKLLKHKSKRKCMKCLSSKKYCKCFTSPMCDVTGLLDKEFDTDVSSHPRRNFKSKWKDSQENRARKVEDDVYKHKKLSLTETVAANVECKPLVEAKKKSSGKRTKTRKNSIDTINDFKTQPSKVSVNYNQADRAKFVHENVLHVSKRTLFKKNVNKKKKILQSSEVVDASGHIAKNNDKNEFLHNSLFNLKYQSKSFKKYLKKVWRNAKLKEECPCSAVVLNKPFKCAWLPDFISEDPCAAESLLDRVVTQLHNINMKYMNNDIFKFHLSQSELPRVGALLELREIFEGPVMQWLLSVTGVPLNDKVSLSASFYKHTDFLLCHDDELEGRRFAFILYLTERGVEWGPGDGGSLDLFSVRECGRPDRVVERLYPARNAFSFFEVSPVSFHQVAEVLSPHKVRLSVHGWFHGPDIQRPAPPLPFPKCYATPGDVEESAVYRWISSVYLSDSLQASIRKQFQKNSEIQLEDFVPEDAFLELRQAFAKCKSSEWPWAGPPNRVHYQVAPDAGSVPTAVDELVAVLCSEAGLLILSQLTGLQLHPLAPTDENSEDSDDSDEDSDVGDSDDDEERRSCIDEEVLLLSTLLKRHKKQVKRHCRSSVLSEHDAEPLKKRRREEGYSELHDGDSLSLPWVADVGFKPKCIGSEVFSKGPSSVSGSRTGSVCASVRRYSHGCYSLVLDNDNIHDGDHSNRSSVVKGKEPAAESSKVVESLESFVLDLYYFPDVPEDWNCVRNGGDMVYVAEDEKEQLLSVTPRRNSLCLVCRDRKTFSFLRHVSGTRPWHVIQCHYK